MAIRRRMPFIVAFICLCLLAYTILWIRTARPQYEQLDQHISSNKPMHPVEEPVSVDEKYLAFFTHSGFQNQLIQGIYIPPLARLIDVIIFMPV
jgi:hypothetical protein